MSSLREFPAPISDLYCQIAVLDQMQKKLNWAKKQLTELILGLKQTDNLSIDREIIKVPSIENRSVWALTI